MLLSRGLVVAVMTDADEGACCDDDELSETGRVLESPDISAMGFPIHVVWQSGDAG